MSWLSGRWAALVLAGVALAVSAGSAAACAICLSAMYISPGERLDNADRAVLANPDGEGGWRIVADIKGTAPVDPAVLAEAAPSGVGGGTTLFLRDGLGHRWSVFGEIGIDKAEWLRRVVTSPAPDTTASDPHRVAEAWQRRLALIRPELESGDPQAEALAHGDLARAPYPAIRDLGRAFDLDHLLEKVAREDSPSRRSAYIMLLGGAGGHAAVAWLDRRIDAAWRAGEATDLAALLAAWIETGGPAGVRHVEQRYLLDTARSLPEIEAALLALSVHGDTEATVPRSEVVAAYRRFVRAHPSMAGFVAMDLGRWEEWGATEDFVSLLNSGAIVDPAGAFAALVYVQGSTDIAARSKLDLPDD